MIRVLQTRKVEAFLRRQGFERRKARGSHELYVKGETTLVFSPLGKDVDPAFIKTLVNTFGYDTVAGL